MKTIINGAGAVMGRLASYSAKQALLGEEIVILNCDKVIISGNRKDIQQRYLDKRKRIGSGQMGPKVSRLSHLIVKRCIRGMLSHRQKRGKEALGRIRCYVGVPEEFNGVKTIDIAKEQKMKSITVGEIPK